MQGQYERKEERPYDYCRILLIRITPCKNDMKKRQVTVRLLQNPFDKDYPMQERHEEKTGDRTIIAESF